jgi:hypothetical protein
MRVTCALVVGHHLDIVADLTPATTEQVRRSGRRGGSLA